VRILISTPWLGGSGGIERHVASTIRSLGVRHEIDVCALRVIDSEYLVRPARGRVIPRGRWWRPGPRHRVLSAIWPVVGPLVRYRPDPYDAYLQYQFADDVRDRFRAATSFVIPCGDDVRHLEADFDVVALEAPDNVRWVGDTAKAVLLPPPLDVPAAAGEPVAGIPHDFFLTIFNPHHPRKGLDDLCAVAAQSCLPIIWCRSTTTRPLDSVPEIPNVVVLENLSQAQLRFLYERCRAYVEFGRNMGFAWAVADALQYGASVLSRRRGVLSLPDLDTTAVYCFDEVDELAAMLRRDDYPHVTRHLSEISPARFVERFERLVEETRSNGRFARD
jgi:hypothetical protein